MELDLGVGLVGASEVDIVGEIGARFRADAQASRCMLGRVLLRGGSCGGSRLVDVRKGHMLGGLWV